MERIQVQAITRENGSKGLLKKLRTEGLVPGIVYGQKSDSDTVAIQAKDITAIIQSPSGANTLVELSLNGKKDIVMIKELKRDIMLADRYTHVDLLRISLKNKLEVQVPLVLTGTAAGVAEGGVVQQVMREITLKCLPTDIPEAIELDISHLAVGESLSAGDLSVPASAELLTDPADAVVTVAAPRLTEDEEGTEAPEEDVAPDTEETQENEE
jgi:large subunit ribosomal protein L25